MPGSLYDRLMEAKARKNQLDKAVRKREELRKRLNEQERKIIQLEIKLEEEQADVDQLTRMSLANLFHTILRSKEEQLELERQQALAAMLKLQEAKEAMEHLKAEFSRVTNELSTLHDAEREYESLMVEKEAALRGSRSAELTEMDEQLSDQAVLVKDLQEAVTAGRRVLASLEDASASLEKAENWGKWDLWGGGGIMSTHFKHSHVDDAKQFILNANRLMASFQDELADLNRTTNIHIDISGMLKMADYWFDGLITDWIVQGRIQNAQEQTLKAMDRVRSVVNSLQNELSSAHSALTNMKAKRTGWIEGNGFSPGEDRG